MTVPEIDLPFSAASRAVFTLAHEECTELRHEYIGTEHLLLVVMRRDDEVKALLQDGGLTLKGARSIVGRLRGPAASFAEISLTPRAKLAVERGAAVAQSLHASEIEPLHFMLGVLQVEDSLALSVLRAAGIDPQQLAEELERR